MGVGDRSPVTNPAGELKASDVVPLQSLGVQVRVANASRGGACGRDFHAMTPLSLIVYRSH